MSRADAVLAQVAAGMQDRERIREVLEDSLRQDFDEANAPHILIDIASAIDQANQPGISPAHWETVGTRLLHTLECYARAALTAKAEDDIAQDDDEDELEK